VLAARWDVGMIGTGGHALRSQSTRLVLQLTTFGGLSVRLDGTPITGAITQRRQLALLALLAVAREEGMSREKLLAYLWPEKEANRARHNLNQLVYFQRRHAGQEGFFEGRKTLRLNPTAVTADVWLFEDALADGAPDRAVQAYRGPFLDGFFLPEAAEFEAWVEQQRRRFGRRCAEALEGLARTALASGGLAEAVGWLRRSQEIDSLDARTAVSLAEALVRSGDRPAALRALRWHREQVWKELEVEADPAVRRLEESLAQSS